jgi:spore maturation protein CgeB
VTLAQLERGENEYLSKALIKKYILYLSFTGGPVLSRLEKRYKSRMARPLYCSVDPALYYPESKRALWDLGYMGTYSPDRQPALEELLLNPARAWRTGKFLVAGPQFPVGVKWPDNVRRINHLPPGRHRDFYNAQRFTLNITRERMVDMGYSPSVRLFEAAACGTPVVSDWWEGLDQFFEIGEEILIARRGEDVLGCLKEMSESERRRIGERARSRVLSGHTSGHRAVELERYARELLGGKFVQEKAGSEAQALAGGGS